MKFFSHAAAAAAILSSSSGGGLVAALPRTIIISPSEFGVSVLGGQTFSVGQVSNGNFITQQRGARALAKVYAKFGVAIPPEILALLEELLLELGLLQGGAGAGRGSGTGSGAGNANQTASANQGMVAAVPQMFDSEYLAQVSIGTPPQVLNLDFDTGSSDLWVFSTETPRAQQKGQKVFDIAASSTAQRLQGATWSIRYGDGSSSSGDVFTDVVSIGGVTVQNQAVESATQVSGSFQNDTASSGLLGLALNKINQVKPVPQPTFFSNAMANLAMPLFTANLKKGEAGNYNFGFINKAEFQGDVSFIDVNTTNGFWQFGAAGFAVGSNATAATMVAMPHQAIADTGTTLLMLPDAIVNAYYAQIPGAALDPVQGGITFDCNAVAPDLMLAVGSYMATVPGSLINFAPAGQGRCFGGIQSAAKLPFAIYGDVFFKSNLVVFKGGQSAPGQQATSAQLGFAAKAV